MAHKQPLQISTLISKKTMKKQQEEEKQEHDTEILKAVAQAWHGLSTKATTTTSEFDAHRRCFKAKPTRFRLEAMSNKASKKEHQCGTSSSWDFSQSLWDSYEIVSVSKKLETCLVMDNAPFPGLNNVVKRRKEGKNSLRNLFNRVSSLRRFDDAELKSQGD